MKSEGLICSCRECPRCDGARLRDPLGICPLCKGTGGVR